MVDRALRRSMSKWRQSRKKINIARRSARSAKHSRRDAAEARSFHKSKCEPDDFDPGGCFDAFVAHDEIQRRCRGLCFRSTSQSRGRSRNDNASRIRGKFARRPFVLLVSNVQETNDENCLFTPAIWLRTFRAAAAVETKVASTACHSSSSGPGGQSLPAFRLKRV